ncbi:hypothetical protein [Alteromonas sp. ASW11-130]|uniref:hypothetical protein n=1 Tax=Alteromonas sp. ASW11-130 TaxID=3015775 RepID=UPI002242926A|nr:hypothetical protein [Alteromonas sp. ASW11-130]MCW8092691.1 hypothetical protein [Alteromonas sp. ASW11-130]
MKNFLVAVVVALILAYGFGDIISEWRGMNIVFGDEILSPIESVLAITAVGVVFVIIGFVIAVSLIGAIVIGLGAAAIALLAMGVSAFWPVLLLVALIYFLRKDNTSGALS